MFIILVLVIIGCLLPIIYLELKYGKIKRKIKHTPGPKTLPIIGNAHQMGKTPSEILSNLFGWFYQYKQDNVRIWIGYYLYIIIANVKDVEFILSSNTLISKSSIYDMLHPWLGEGLLTSTGTKWHKHRKMITPSFHFKILHDFHEVMNINCNKFIDKLRVVAKGGTILDIQDHAHYFTLDVICDTAMGVHYNAMDNHDLNIVQAFKYMCYNIKMRAFHPLKRSATLYKLFPEYKDYYKNLKVLQDFTYEVIEKRIETRKQEEANKTTVVPDEEFNKRKMAFLDTLLSSTIDGRPLNTQEIYEEVSTFIFEGHDTTTSGISFAIYLLSRHLGVQQKVYEEQQQMMGSNMKSDATYQDLQEMKYLDLVLKEAQRLYPSVPMIGRLAEKDYNINGKTIPKGSSLNVFLMTLGYNEKSFPDPYRFHPERFDTSNTVKRNPFEYVPFSAGPRNCIGQKFAQLEIKTVVSKIVRNFEILPALDELASNDGYVSTYFGPYKENKTQHAYEPILSAVITLKSENGILIRLKERN